MLNFLCENTFWYLKFTKNPPAFFTNDALRYIYASGIQHLVVDIPSLDRMEDNSLLGNHRIFWGENDNPHCNVNSKSEKTITELAYIPNNVKDGFYFLSI